MEGALQRFYMAREILPSEGGKNGGRFLAYFSLDKKCDIKNPRLISVNNQTPIYKSLASTSLYLWLLGRKQNRQFITDSFANFVVDEKLNCNTIKLSDAAVFFLLLEQNKFLRNPKVLCTDCWAFMSSYQRKNNRMDHVITTPSAFSTKEKFIDLALKCGKHDND